MKVVYMGTPDFAVSPLEKLMEEGHEVLLVITQPDREKGRGKGIAQSPVKECAIKHGIEVFQPEKIKDPEAVSFVKKFDADIFVVAAFGQILSEEILSIPKYGCINIHASLLPKYRGAAPIQWAVLNGEEYSGVTIMQMAKGLDTGDILTQEKIKLSEDETGDSLFDKLTDLGADLLIKTLPLIEKGKIIPQKQDEALSTYAGKITKDMGLLDFNKDSKTLERFVRGLNSWPSAYTHIDGKTLKIWEAEASLEKVKNTEPGTVINVSSDSFDIVCGEGLLRVRAVQLEGKKRMSVHDFLLGYRIKEGTRVGDKA